eukprot:symbB.v1.2.005353.t1/scaffold301.1/size235092/5
MGIKQLGKFLKSNCPSAMSHHSCASDYKEAQVAIDVSPCLYQCMTAMGDTPPGVQPGSELDTSHIVGLFRRSVRLLELGIKPIFVFDGEAPEMKSHQRAKHRARSKELLEEAQAVGDEEAMKRYGARLVKATQRHNDEAMELLRMMGLPVLRAPGEAERLCAQLAQSGYAKAAATEDFDALVFGAPKVLRNLHHGSASPQLPLVQEICLSEILAQLHFSQLEFVDFCILAGCDYLPTISKKDDYSLPPFSLKAIIAEYCANEQAAALALIPSVEAERLGVCPLSDLLAAAKCIELLPDAADTETSQRREWKASDVMPEAPRASTIPTPSRRERVYVPRASERKEAKKSVPSTRLLEYSCPYSSLSVSQRPGRLLARRDRVDRVDALGKSHGRTGAPVAAAYPTQKGYTQTPGSLRNREDQLSASLKMRSAHPGDLLTVLQFIHGRPWVIQCAPPRLIGTLTAS